MRILLSVSLIFAGLLFATTPTTTYADYTSANQVENLEATSTADIHEPEPAPLPAGCNDSKWTITKEDLEEGGIAHGKNGINVGDKFLTCTPQTGCRKEHGKESLSDVEYSLTPHGDSYFVSCDICDYYALNGCTCKHVEEEGAR